MPFQINKILCIEDEKKPTDNIIEYVITELGSDDLNTVRICFSGRYSSWICIIVLNFLGFGFVAIEYVLNLSVKHSRLYCTIDS